MGRPSLPPDLFPAALDRLGIALPTTVSVSYVFFLVLSGHF